MMYAYPFTLCRRAIVATFDLSAVNLKMFRTDHWLSDARNVVQLHLTEPAWEADGPVPVRPAVSAHDKMKSWTVDELAGFLVEEDLRGPAEALRRAGVNGHDFLLWTTREDLQAELGLPKFTAKKLLAARDLFLR